MKNNFVFFLGLFAALLISWAGIVLGSNAQLGGLAPYYDDNESNSFPQWMPGIAARGQLVYRDLGCAACHTQQVRRPGFGSDQARGWGDRQSVARDYIFQPAPQLGLSRVGPDLVNLGDRKPSAPDADDLLNRLYAGSEGMPSYRFLFTKRRIGSEAQPSDMALKLTGALEPKAGWEIVPTPRALALVGYLVNLKNSYDYPESVPVAAPKAEGEAPAAAPAASASTPKPGDKAPPGSGSTTPTPNGSPAPTTAPAPGSTTPVPNSAPAPTAASATGSTTPTPAGGAAPGAPAAPQAAGSTTPAPTPTAPPKTEAFQ